MEKTNIFLILVFTIPLLYMLSKNYMVGLSAAVFLQIILPSSIRISISGNFPELTIHRIILVCLFFFWLRNRDETDSLGQIPFILTLSLLSIATFLSLVLSVDFNQSTKSYLSFIIENISFYVIVVSSIQDRDAAVRLMRFSLAALVVVGILAVVERYTGFNPVYHLPGVPEIKKARIDVISTYGHRILLGSAMAMGWPIGLVLMEIFGEEKGKNRFLWISVAVLIAGCYFSMSRGPWLASFIGGSVFFLLCSPSVKKRIVFFLLIAFVVLMMRPGVWSTIFGKYAVTVNTGLKRETYLYRWELWKKAYEEILRSKTRTLFGYGPGSHHFMEMEATLSYSMKKSTFWSWDNHFACDLLEYGFVGFSLIMLLHILVLAKTLQIWRRLEGVDKTLVAGILASLVMYVFMKTNVRIYIQQLNYLFWTLLSIAVSFGKVNDWEEEHFSVEDGHHD